MHRVFVSYHHKNDQEYKKVLVDWAKENKIFEDYSVGLGDIPEDWDDQKVRETIRDEYLRESTVTIVLVGTETKFRKHVDWEIYSSMHDGTKNKKSGIIVILLPSAKSTYYTCGFDNEKSIYPEQKWISITERSEYERRFPYMPARIIDNLLKSGVNISVINWDKVTVENLTLMIENAYKNRANQDYDMTRPMRERNYNLK